jgi:hypothetical protein
VNNSLVFGRNSNELWYFDYASGTHINYVLLHNDANAIKVKSFQNDEHLNYGWMHLYLKLSWNSKFYFDKPY